MKGYENYKDSGVEWIGKIPEHWVISKYKFSVNILSGFPFKSELFSKEKGVPLIRIRDISSGTIETFYDGDYSEDYIVKKDDLVVGMDGDFNVRWWNNVNALLNQRCCSIKSIEEVSVLRFLFYVIPNDLKIINDLAYYTTVKHLSNNDLYNRNLILPSLEEQTKIAAFLDYKTSLIDATIEKKKRLIELLKEKRQAIINEAVTKGLSPITPMKDSGVDWLGEIPEHWEVKRLRHIGFCQNGVSQAGEYFGSGFPFVSYGDVYKNEVLPFEVKGLANSTEDDKIRFSVEKGDVFFTRTSETIEEIGIASTCLQTIENAVFAGFLIKFRPFKNILDPNFSKYYFRSFIPRHFFVKEMNLVTRASLSQDLLKNLPIILPSLEEQLEIAKSIEKVSCIIDKSITSIKLAIEKLQTYRQSLISEAVTGKIDVRDWQSTTKNT